MIVVRQQLFPFTLSDEEPFTLGDCLVNPVGSLIVSAVIGVDHVLLFELNVVMLILVDFEACNVASFLEEQDFKSLFVLVLDDCELFFDARFKETEDLKHESVVRFVSPVVHGVLDSHRRFPMKNSLVSQIFNVFVFKYKCLRKLLNEVPEDKFSHKLNSDVQRQLIKKVLANLVKRNLLVFIPSVSEVRFQVILYLLIQRLAIVEFNQQSLEPRKQRILFKISVEVQVSIQDFNEVSHAVGKHCHSQQQDEGTY